MKQLFFPIVLSGVLVACSSSPENKKNEGKEMSKDTLKKVEENKEKTEERTEQPEVKETEETVKEEP